MGFDITTGMLTLSWTCALIHSKFDPIVRRSSLQYNWLDQQNPIEEKINETFTTQMICSSIYLEKSIWVVNLFWFVLQIYFDLFSKYVASSDWTNLFGEVN